MFYFPKLGYTKTMEKPYKFTIICNKTKGMTQTNIEPTLRSLQTWEPFGDEKTSILVQTKTCYFDTRYEAKLRLYNYITYKKNGLEVPNYKPYKNTDIGVNKPILNF